MHVNEFLLLGRAVPKCSGRILEVGSREYPESGHTAQNVYRGRYPDAQEFVGLDLQDGPNVDVVGDLTTGLCGLEPGFDLVICCAVLEHVKRPWQMAANIERLLAPGGILYVTVPWVWRFHAYPDDYWRISWAGVRELFPNINWRDPVYSTYAAGEFVNVRANPDADDRLAKMIEGRKYLPYLTVHMIGDSRGA